MKVVFVKTVKNVGKPGDVKEVATGYAVNFLIPNGFAVVAGKDALNRLKQKEEHRKAEEDAIRSREREILSATNGKRITIRSRSENGKLFGSIHPRAVVAACAEAGIPGIPEKAIVMEKPIRGTGSFPVRVRFGSAKAEFIVEVVEERKKG